MTDVPERTDDAPAQERALRTARHCCVRSRGIRRVRLRGAASPAFWSGRSHRRRPLLPLQVEGGLGPRHHGAQPQQIQPKLASQGLQRLVDITLVWACELQVNPLLRAGCVSRWNREFRRPGPHFLSGLEEDNGQCLEDAAQKGELLSGDRSGTSPSSWSARAPASSCTPSWSATADLPERTVLMWRTLLPGIASRDDRTHRPRSRKR